MYTYGEIDVARLAAFDAIYRKQQGHNASSNRYRHTLESSMVSLFRYKQEQSKNNHKNSLHNLHFFFTYIA